MTRAIADQSRTIRIPVHMNETLTKYLRISREAEKELGRAPKDEEIARRMDTTAEKVQEAIVQLPSDAPAPSDLLYTHLAAPPALANFQGKRVPMLVFVHRDDQRAGSDRAVVYLISTHDFDVKKLPANFASAGSFNYHMDVVPQDADHAYLVIHTGTDWKWLRASAGE